MKILKLFSEENAAKDFTITIGGISMEDDMLSKAVLVGNMDESGDSYPGFVLRRYGTSFTFDFIINENSTNSTTIQFPSRDINKISIMRKSGVMYVKINDDWEQYVLDISSFNNYFDSTMTFGAGIDGSGNYFRFFHGSLSDIEIKIQPDEQSLEP